MNYINYKIKSNQERATFYTSSKEKIEGYKEVDLKEKGIFYHKEVRDVTGTLETIKLRDGKFGKTVEIYLKQDNGDIAVISNNVFRNSTSIYDYAKSITKIIPGLKVGKKYEFWLNNKIKDKKGFLYKTVNANLLDGENKAKVDWAFTKDDVPAGEKVQHPVTGVETWNFDKNNAFFYQKLQEFVSMYTPKQHADTAKADEVYGFKEDVVENNEEEINPEDIPF